VIGLCVLGPSGRMGQLLVEQASRRSDMKLTAAVDAAGSPIIGTQVAPGVVATSDLAAGLGTADVYVDFTVPVSTLAAARAAADRGIAAVIGTTGLGDVERAAIDTLARRVPVVFAPNFSLGVNVLLSLAESAARALGHDFDFEVVEIHHKHKRDAPSGTALALAGSLARGRGQDLDQVACYARSGDVGARPPGEIGVLAVRGGEIPGEHTAFLIGDAERLELTHRAASRAIFATGALRAIAWVHGKPAGLYSMRDVLGL
jgi:4-hydroxy-tetrahydrodipicolinate reductase